MMPVKPRVETLQLVDITRRAARRFVDGWQAVERSLRATITGVYPELPVSKYGRDGLAGEGYRHACASLEHGAEQALGSPYYVPERQRSRRRLAATSLPRPARAKARTEARFHGRGGVRRGQQRSPRVIPHLLGARH